MNKLTFFVTMFALAVSPAIGYTQTLTIKEGPKHIGDYLHEFFKPDPNRLISINYAAPQIISGWNRNTAKTRITCYDSSLNEVYNAKVKALAGNKYLAGLVVANKLHILYAKNKQIFRDELNQSDGQTKGSPTELLTVSKQPVNVYTGFSPDSNYCFAVFTDYENKVYDGVFMDKRLNVVTKFSYELGKVGGDIRKTDCILSPDGTLYIVNRINAKSSKNDYRPKRYIITAVSRDGQTVSTPLTDLPEGLIDNLVWKAEKNILSFVGLLSRSEKENYTVILSGEFNSSQKKVSNLKQSMINDSPFWQNAAGYLQDCQKGIGTDKELVSSISGDNGSVTLVLLKTDYTVIFRGNYSTVRSNASDAFVVKINRNGELDWLQFVSFGQVELSEPAYSGVIATSPNKKDLFLFFQDDSSNHNIPPGGSYSTITFPNSWPKAADLAVVHITESGVLSRKSADQAKDPHFHLAGHLPYLVVGNEITYTSFFYINAGGSKYRPGSIKITLP